MSKTLQLGLILLAVGAVLSYISHIIGKGFSTFGSILLIAGLLYVTRAAIAQKKAHVQQPSRPPES